MCHTHFFLLCLLTPLHNKDQACKSCMIHGLSKHMFRHRNRLCKSSRPSYIQCSTFFTHCAYPRCDGHIPSCVLHHILVKQWTSGAMQTLQFTPRKPICESCSERITPSTRTANVRKMSSIPSVSSIHPSPTTTSSPSQGYLSRAT